MGTVGVVGATDDVFNYCIGDEVTLTGTTNIEGGVISWCDENNVELTVGDTYTFTPSGPTTIIVKLDGDNSCVDTSIVSILPFDFGPGTELEQLDFGFSQDDCSSTEICFNANTDAGGTLIWAISGMGILDTIFADQNPCYDFAAGGTGTYNVSLSAPDAPCAVSPLTQTITVGGNMDIGILGVDDGILNYCEGDMVTAVATTTVDNPQISWCVDGVVVETGDTYTFLGSDIEELTVKLGAGTDCGDTLLVAVEAYDFGPGTENDSLFYTVDQPDCESLEVCFTPNTTADGNLVWVITGEGIAQVIADDGEEFCFVFPTSGTYDVQLTAPDAPCEVFPYNDNIEVYDVQATVTIDNGESVAFCEEGMLALSAMSNIGNENIKWCDADGNEVGQGATLDIMFTEPTFYVAKAGTIAACSSADTVMVNGFDIGDALINAPDIGCEGDQVIATVEGLEPGDYSYNWTPSDCINGDVTGVSAEIIGQGLKVINVEVTDNTSGCSATLMHTITFSEFGPVNLEIIENDTIFLGQEVTINVINGDDNWTYEWSTGESGVGVSSITLEPTDTDIYTVTITDENGCTTSLEMLVVVLQPNCDETDIYLPNAFTPNGDSTNDVFIPRSNFIEEVEFFVYNRWGEEIFFSTDMNEGWDGTYKGETLAPDVFAYCLKVTCPNNEEFVKSGNVSLIR
jgi:gliding motility-associated-like protein